MWSKVLPQALNITKVNASEQSGEPDI